MSDTLFAELDAALAGTETGGDDKPTWYSIAGKAGDDPREQGRLAAYHIQRIADARSVREAQSGALDFEESLAKARLRAVEVKRELLGEWFTTQTHHDRSVLYEWAANTPAIKGLRAKSFPCGIGKVGSKTQTTRESISINAPDELLDVLPDCVKRSLIVSEAKKHLVVGPEGTVIIASEGIGVALTESGVAVDAETGEELTTLPVTVASSTAASSRDTYCIEIGGEKIELVAYVQTEEDETDGSGPDGNTEAGTGADDGSGTGGVDALPF